MQNFESTTLRDSEGNTKVYERYFPSCINAFKMVYQTYRNEALTLPPRKFQFIYLPCYLLLFITFVLTTKRTSRSLGFERGLFERNSKELGIDDSKNRPIETATRELDDRPTVYSWYVKRPKNIEELDTSLIEGWKKAWNENGYIAEVLGIDDAKKHKDYDEFEFEIDYQFRRKYAKSKYNLKECYYRYLAMAAKGGGMMVDLDTLPIGTREKNDPPKKFTLYCPLDVSSVHNTQIDNWLDNDNKRMSGIPCVAAGESDEWLRIAKRSLWLTKQYAIHHSEWTDMHSVLLLRDRDEVDVVPIELATSTATSGWDSCAFRSTF